MKIGELNQHCGECDIIDFCGNAFGYCVCAQERFKDIETETYKKYAETAKLLPYSECTECRYDGQCDECYSEDEARDWMCEQIAGQVTKIIKGKAPT